MVVAAAAVPFDKELELLLSEAEVVDGAVESEASVFSSPFVVAVEVVVAVAAATGWREVEEEGGDDRAA